MDDGITGIPWASIGTLTPYGLSMLAVLMVLTGRLIPKNMYDALQKQKEHWRDAAEKLRDTNAVQARTIDKQTMVGESVIKVMGAVQEARDGEPK